MSAETSRAALQRSIGKIFYHAGFEEFQPSALDTVTDIATDYFQKLGKTLMLFKEAPQHERRFTAEVGLQMDEQRIRETDRREQEVLLHAMHENGADVEGLDAYIRDDVERLGTKLTKIHERMKAYLAELLVSTGAMVSRISTNGCSVPHSRIQVATTRDCSTTVVSSSSGVTLRMTSARTSSVSRTLAWTRSLVCLAHRSPSISCKAA